MLAGELDRGRSQTFVVFGVVLVLVAVVVFVGVRSLRRAPGTVVEVAGDSSHAEVAPSLPDPAPLPAAPTAEEAATTTSLSPALYSEADLMAVAPEQEQRWVAARAEWFVTEHFTIDREGESGSATWVEWARTAEVRPAGPGRYDVVVVFSSLAQSAAGDFHRTGLRAVQVPVEVGAEGTVVVADLPQPAVIEGWETFDPPGGGDGDVPPDIATAAIEMGKSIGPEVVVVGGSPGGAGWRVVIEISDPPGPAVPLVVDVPG